MRLALRAEGMVWPAGRRPGTHKAEATLSSLLWGSSIPPLQPVRSYPLEIAWGMLGAKLARGGLRTGDELFAALQRMWNDVDLAFANRLAASFELGLGMVMEVSGNTVSHWLSSRMRPKPQDVRECVAVH